MKRGIILLVLLSIVVAFFWWFKNDNAVLMADLTGMNQLQVKTYAYNNSLSLTLSFEYHDEIVEGLVISQSILANQPLEENQTLIVVISGGPIPEEVYLQYKVNELGSIPIMMYHGIHQKLDSETSYPGGNIDIDGYQRTSESFRRDLEMYYENGYRMIRLMDYVDGIIDVELGKSPLILTFDDGLANNAKVVGKDENGQLLFDPESAIGILEEFKQKYEDFHITATFFLNEALFEQPEYNEAILKWLIENGYDIGNHSMSHADFTKIDVSMTMQEIGGMYQLLDQMIPDQYVNIVALPFGSPYQKSHANFEAILTGTYQDIFYQTKATLRVGWLASESPFLNTFDVTFLKRIRAYDQNGTESDIASNFTLLEKNRYISDGNPQTITIPISFQESVKQTDMTVITYDNH